MRVLGHPHTGLQTVSWLFDGEIEHRDTLGTHALVRPREMNLMTAGSGIAHSEHSTAATRTLRGAQLWVALPDRHRSTAPAFVHHVPPVAEVDGARVLTFLGSLAGTTSPVETFTPLVGAEVAVPAGRRVLLDVDPGFEHGVLVDEGPGAVCGEPVPRDRLAYLSCGRDRLELAAPPGGPARVLVLGGEPLGERIIMWWNFIGRSHDEIVEFRRQWQRERAEPRGAGARRFGRLPAQWATTLPAPELPNARLTARG
jgi:redox-sensitive bicupin YhaK (pirin superfamily)